MSGGYIPYHLRHNKSIDREVFLEGLSKLNRVFDISSYTYIGFGGPMLEDFRHVHSKMTISHLISLEEDPVIFKRQLYNQPFVCIDCRKLESSQFIENHPYDKPTITWLDYASAKKIGKDLDDIKSLSTKVSDGDILKVTFPVNPASYYNRKHGETAESFAQNFEKAVKSKLSRSYTTYNFNVSEKDVSPKNLITLMSDILIDAYKLALERGLSGRRKPMVYIPLVINRYNDGVHTMLTIFGVFRYKELYRETMELCQLNDWNFISNHWKDIQEISIPTLTIKEKIELDSHLPLRNKYMKAAMDISLSEEESKNYFKYYRLYPNFQRIMI
ncbi:hypothetical protein RVX52_000765 [Enterobacter cloacae]|nr:hypothetical protein [Enterobacter cloacae]